MGVAKFIVIVTFVLAEIGVSCILFYYYYKSNNDMIDKLEDIEHKINEVGYLLSEYKKILPSGNTI